MIITGRISAQKASPLAQYLGRSGGTNHLAGVVITGVVASTLPRALSEMQAVAKGARCTSPFYHATINPEPTRTLSDEDWREAVAALGRALNLHTQPRILVFHDKKADFNGVNLWRRHAHVVWSRVDGTTMTVIPAAYHWLTCRRVATKIAHRLGHSPVVPSQSSGPRYTIAEQQQANNAGTAFKQSVKLWQQWWSTGRPLDDTPNGAILARGDRSLAPLVMTNRGGPVSLSRLVRSVSPADIIAAFDLKALPSVAAARDELYNYREGRSWAYAIGRDADNAAEAQRRVAAEASFRWEAREILNTEAAQPGTPVQRTRPERAAVQARVKSAMQLVAECTIRPPKEPETAVFEWFPDRVLNHADDDLVDREGPFWTGPVPALVRVLRQLGMPLIERTGEHGRQTVSCDHRDLAAAILGAGARANTPPYLVLDMLRPATAATAASAALTTIPFPVPDVLIYRDSSVDGPRARRAELRARVCAAAGLEEVDQDSEWCWFVGPEQQSEDSAGPRLLAMVKGAQLPVVLQMVEGVRTVARVSARILIDHIVWLSHVAAPIVEAWAAQITVANMSLWDPERYRVERAAARNIELRESASHYLSKEMEVDADTNSVCFAWRDTEPEPALLRHMREACVTISSMDRAAGYKLRFVAQSELLDFILAKAPGEGGPRAILMAELSRTGSHSKEVVAELRSRRIMGSPATHHGSEVASTDVSHELLRFPDSQPFMESSKGGAAVPASVKPPTSPAAASAPIGAARPKSVAEDVATPPPVVTKRSAVPVAASAPSHAPTATSTTVRGNSAEEPVGRRTQKDADNAPARTMRAEAAKPNPKPRSPPDKTAGRMILDSVGRRAAKIAVAADEAIQDAADFVLGATGRAVAAVTQSLQTELLERRKQRAKTKESKKAEREERDTQARIDRYVNQEARKKLVKYPFMKDWEAAQSVRNEMKRGERVPPADIQKALGRQTIAVPFQEDVRPHGDQRTQPEKAASERSRSPNATPVRRPSRKGKGPEI